MVAERIVRDIVARGLKPGMVLATESRMLEQLGVGRATLREALRLLESQGVISMRTGRSGGPVIQELSPNHLAYWLSMLFSVARTSISEIIEARKVFEPLVAYTAAENASSSDGRALLKNVEQMRAAIEDEQLFLHINAEFHSLVATASGNHVLTTFQLAIADIADGHQVGIRYDRRAREGALAAHIKVATAIASHRPAAASAAMAQHINALTVYLTRTNPKLLDRRVRILTAVADG